MNRTYHEMAEHYNTAIIPARVKAPDDKPNAEGSVNVMETWIIAALRNRPFFSFEELNRAVREKLVNKSGSENPESVALVHRNGGSESPDRWLKVSRDIQRCHA